MGILPKKNWVCGFFRATFQKYLIFQSPKSRVQTEKSKSNSSTFQGPFKDPLTKFKDPIGVVFKFRFEFTLIL